MSHQYPAYSSDRAAAVQPMSKKTAAADTMLVLEQEIVAALADADINSSDLSALIERTEAAITETDQAAETARSMALDPVLSPDAKAAREAMQAAEFCRDRLRAVLPRLQARLAEVQAAEVRARWVREYERVQAVVENAACKFAEYPDLAARLIAIFRDAEEVDQEVAIINSSAPPGEHRRLRQTELVARGLEAFSRSAPAISKTVQLCDWADSERLIWPPRELPIAALFAMSMVPQRDPRFSADWAAAQKEDNVRRAATEARWAEEEAARQAESKRQYEASLRR